MRIAMLAAAISLSAAASPLEPSCKGGDGPCWRALEAAARSCAEVKALRLGTADVRWRRCGPPEPQWPADGGSLTLPRSFLLIGPPGEGAAYAFGPDQDPPTVLNTVEPVATSWLFVRSSETGAASMSHWALLDLSRMPPVPACCPSRSRRARKRC